MPGEPNSTVMDLTSSKKKKKKPKINGGKYGFDDYSHANTITHEVDGVHVGDTCQHCGLGKYYFGEDRKLLTMTGSPMVKVERHIKKCLRCNRCGYEAISAKKIVKWTPEAKSAIVINKIYGMPWYRMARIQKLFGMPIAISTLWQQAETLWQEVGQPVVSKLYELGIESPIWGSDDTGARILSVKEANKFIPEDEQRACHTTAVCMTHGEFKINLYMTANRYCRENWLPLLDRRQSKEKLVIVTDASSQSLPRETEADRVDSAVCLGGHARRKFSDIELKHVEECQYFLNLISDLYDNEVFCKSKRITREERLAYHQEHSQPIIDAIYAKIDQLFTNREVEPNSDLGAAMKYWLNHKKALTLFLRVAGVPLDTNWVERALRLMACYRNASLFFKTLRSAMIISDLFSLVSTAEANDVNAFAYLVWLQKNWKEVQKNPEAYLPWCFRQETEKIAA